MTKLTNQTDTASETAVQNPFDVLKRLRIAAIRAKHPNLPEKFIPAPQYRDNTANNLTKCVIDFIKLSGYQAERISNTGRLIDNTQVVEDVLGSRKLIGSTTWLPGSGTKGTSDVSATIAGRSIKIEIKLGKDKQSPAQVAYQKSIEDAGGVYLIVKNFPDFFYWFKEFVKPKTLLNGSNAIK